MVSFAMSKSQFSSCSIENRVLIGDWLLGRGRFKFKSLLLFDFSTTSYGVSCDWMTLV